MNRKSKKELSQELNLAAWRLESWLQPGRVCMTRVANLLLARKCLPLDLEELADQPVEHLQVFVRVLLWCLGPQDEDCNSIRVLIVSGHNKKQQVLTPETTMDSTEWSSQAPSRQLMLSMPFSGVSMKATLQKIQLTRLWMVRM